MQQLLTCCLQLIFSAGVFFVKLDKNESGKTKAALPTRTNPSKIELTPMDLPGLQLERVRWTVRKKDMK
jgi:hypothetical protein